MPNLIEQMNVLKGLTDEHLQGEVSAPSGAAPPYLVLSELNRRKDMRQRYEGEAARRKQRTTVVEDMVPARNSAAGGGAPTGGLDALGTSGPAPVGAPAPVGFATGGLVDYNDIAERYQTKLAGLDGADNARAMALLAASGAILDGNSSNTLKNVGSGITAGLTSYQDQMQLASKEETDLLRSLLDVGQAQSALDLSREDRDFRERQLAQERELADARLATERTPAGLQTLKYLKDHPEDVDLYKSTIGLPGGNTEFGQDARAQAAFSGVFDDVVKQVKDRFNNDRRSYSNKPEDKIAMQQEIEKAAYAEAVARYEALYPEFRSYADIYKSKLGTLGAPDAAVVDQKDPLGLGL